MTTSPTSADDRLDLFISYQGADKDFAERLAAAIEASEEGRFSVFFAAWDIRAGQNIVAELDKALEKSRFFGLVLSPEYLEADWTTGERAAAVYSDPAGRLGRVIPIMARRCQLPPLLRFRKYVDFETLGFNLGVQQIVTALKATPLRPVHALEGGSIAGGPGRSQETAASVLDGSRPDAVTDHLYLNILPVSKRPQLIWHAPTRVKTRADVFRYFGPNRSVPPFILADNRIFTFAKLSGDRHPFTGVAEDYDTATETWESWTRNKERSQRLHWLLDDCLREKTRALRLSFDRRGKKFYYEQGVLRDQKYKAFTRGSGKDFVIDYTERGGSFVAHRAVNLRFILLGLEPFLRIESGWVFTHLTGEIIEDRRRIVLNSRFTSAQRNSANFNEIRFWTWFLAGDEPVLKLELGSGETLDVVAELRPIETDFGILGDSRSLSPVRSAPELIFAEDEEESIDIGREESEDSDDQD
jgi:hypothetical protein